MQKPAIKPRALFVSILAFSSLFFALLFFYPQQVAYFINIPGLLLVSVGTLAAILICRPIHDVRRVLASLPLLLKNNPTPAYSEINQLLSIADHYRHGRLRSAEEELSYISNDFLRIGIQQVIDGAPREDVHKLLHWQKEGIRSREMNDAQILRLMASFAPAFGMLGTVLGLILMLHNLNESTVATIGSAMGFALITTLYGIIASNLLLKPLAIKKQQRVEQLLSHLTMLEEGIRMLHQRQHPVIIKDTLDAFSQHHFNNTLSVKPNPLLQAHSVH